MEQGMAIRWPDLDEDVSVAGIISGVDERPVVVNLEVTGDTIRLWLEDGRTVTVPLDWYPRLCDGSAAERNNWRAMEQGMAIRWPDLDEDVSVAGIISGVDERPVVVNLEVTGDTIRLWLEDGRTVTVPLDWYPRLCDGSAAERNNWRAMEQGMAIRWPDLDEDVSVAGIISGPTCEGAASLGRWLLARREGRGIKGYEIAEWRRSRTPVPLR